MRRPIAECLLVVCLLVIARGAMAMGGKPPDELIVSHPRQLALITNIETHNEDVPAGVTLQSLYAHAAEKLKADGIEAYSIREDGCEVVEGKEAWFKEPCDAFVEISVELASNGAFTVYLRFHRNLQFTSGGKPYYINAVTWSHQKEAAHVGVARPVFQEVDNVLGAFLSVYKSSNKLHAESSGSGTSDPPAGPSASPPAR